VDRRACALIRTTETVGTPFSAAVARQYLGEMNGPTLTRSGAVATIDLRDHELDAAEAAWFLEVLALPELERVVIELHDRSSLGASANVLLRGLEAHIGLHGVAVEVHEDAPPGDREDGQHLLDV